MGVIKDRRKVCNLCKREVGIHGWAHGINGRCAVHNCPHGKRCKTANLGRRLGPDCDECHGWREWGFRNAG